MATNSETQSVSPTEQEIISSWYRKIGTGWRTMSRDKRSMIAKASIKAKWELRRMRYGPTGQRPNDYKQWRKAHGLPPVSDITGVP